MPRLLAGACAAVLLTGAVAEAGACTCPEPAPACQAYWSSDVIFRGRAVTIGAPFERGGSTYRMIAFAVLEGFKGAARETIEVRAPVATAPCGLRFTEGHEYFVHAGIADGVAATNWCYRTRRIARAAEDLAFARGVAAGGSPLGRISGRVRLRGGMPRTGQPHAIPLRDVPVTLRRGDEFAVMIRTDSRGRFEAVGLAPGIYSLTPSLQGRFEIESAPVVELKDARGCAAIDLDLRADGRITGRVVDASGDPVRGLTLDLMSAGPENAPALARAVTDRHGRFLFSGLPPGRFVVGLKSGPARRDEVRAWFPGVLDSDDSEPVELTPGGYAALDDFAIPASLRLVPIAGVILDPLRRPAAGARVYLRGPDAGDAIVTAPVTTDVNGRFTIAGFEGEAYALFAERPRPDNPGRLEVSEVIRVVATQSASRLALQLRPLH